MNILCAPDSFKESISAANVARAMAEGIREAFGSHSVQIDQCPVGDGGEGTLEALCTAMNGRMHTVTVTGPLGTQVSTRYSRVNNGKTAIVELAQASGLALVPPAHRNPLFTTTYGTGELIRHAIEEGSREILVCIGGSATVDGGTGIAQALGAKFFDRTSTVMKSPLMGGVLNQIHRVELPCFTVPIRVACDVTNPLCGPQGAAAVYGPQKGATAQQVRELERGLKHLAEVVGGHPDVPGAGAAGGAGFGLMALCGATLERGIDLVLDAVHFDARCKDAHLVLTGEGRLDRQSLNGKACIGVAHAALKLGVPTIAIVGSLGEGAELCLREHGGPLHSCISLAERFGLDRALHDTANALRSAAAVVVHAFPASR